MRDDNRISVIKQVGYKKKKTSSDEDINSQVSTLNIEDHPQINSNKENIFIKTPAKKYQFNLLEIEKLLNTTSFTEVKAAEISIVDKKIEIKESNLKESDIKQIEESYIASNLYSKPREIVMTSLEKRIMKRNILLKQLVKKENYKYFFKNAYLSLKKLQSQTKSRESVIERYERANEMLQKNELKKTLMKSYLPKVLEKLFQEKLTDYWGEIYYNTLSDDQVCQYCMIKRAKYECQVCLLERNKLECEECRQWKEEHSPRNPEESVGKEKSN